MSTFTPNHIHVMHHATSDTFTVSMGTHSEQGGVQATLHISALEARALANAVLFELDAREIRSYNTWRGSKAEADNDARIDLAQERAADYAS